MVKVHPLVHKVEFQVDSYLPSTHNSPDLLASIQLPMELVHPMNDLRAAFIDILPNIPLNLADGTLVSQCLIFVLKLWCGTFMEQAVKVS